MHKKTMENILIRLKAYFDPYVKTQLADWYAIGNDLALEQIKNRAIVKQPGEKEEFLRFILDGAAALLVDTGSTEVCLDLCFENEFLGDFESLSDDKPTKFYIRTFEPVFAAVIEKSRFFQISTAHSPRGIVAWTLVKQQHTRSLVRYREYLTETVEDRYLNLLEGRPDILLRTPQRYLASYLGISTQYLNMIRKKVGRKS